MPALNIAALLAAWEEGAAQSSVERGLSLLVTAWPEFSRERWALESIGVRDGCLLTLREELFGSHLEAAACCPKCGERIESTFSTEQIRVLKVEGTQPGKRLGESETLRIEAGGFQIDCRLPTSADLLEIAHQSGVKNGRETLLARCIQTAIRGNSNFSVSSLPDEVVKTVIDRMADADPQADVQIALTCPVCQHRWSMVFDILSYLWNEIDDWAQRLLREVYALASAFGWSERDILGMSARRRHLYLEMIGA